MFSEMKQYFFLALQVNYLQSCDPIQSEFVIGNVNKFKLDKQTDEPRCSLHVAQ